jgi:RNA recognition motif-containing protein
MGDENKIFVGGLSWNTDDEGLRNAFQGFGDIVEAKVIHDRETGRSRGFGFVTFGNGDAVAKALSLNGTELDGRTIRVDRAGSREGGRGGAGGAGGGARRGFGRY